MDIYSKQTESEKHTRYFYLILNLVVLCASFVADILTPLGISVYVFYIFGLSLTYNLSRSQILIFASVYSILIVTGHFLSPSGVSAFSITNRFLTIVVVLFIVYILLRRKAFEKEKDRLFDELRKSHETIDVLRGLLPICANCKKIRDDSGNWHRVEEYFSSRTDVMFSHGICPDCARELYPDIILKVVQKEHPKK